MLLMQGADVHAVNPRGRGVLHLAVTEHDLPAIETLIEGMADVMLGSTWYLAVLSFGVAEDHEVQINMDCVSKKSLLGELGLSTI
jgi:hypothetical protein